MEWCLQIANEGGTRIQPSLRDSILRGRYPGLEVRGYIHSSLRDWTLVLESAN